MYSHCLFCHRDLGRNPVIGTLPVGRRLAFDEARGRLWVVCRRCSRWNLTPIEERWETIEECERHYRATPRRASTEQVGWSQSKSGLELIRIGRPLLPEFAGWRYGRQLTRRRRRYVAGAVVGLGAAAAATTSIPFILATSVVGSLPIYLAHRTVRARSIIPKVHVRAESGSVLSVSRLHMQVLVVRSDDSSEGWHLEVAHADGLSTLRGTAAAQALTQLLPALNDTGASRRTVRHAVSGILEAGDPDRYLASISRGSARSWTDHRLVQLPRESRLALEIAANEENERRALQGDLAALEQAWRDAEEIAAIADDLTVPESVSWKLRHHSTTSQP